MTALRIDRNMKVGPIDMWGKDTHPICPNHSIDEPAAGNRIKGLGERARNGIMGVVR